MQAKTIHHDTRLGSIALTVSDIHRSVQFYQEILGFSLRRREAQTASLGADGKELLHLQEDRQAPHPPPQATGLYHFAILLPSRLELARALRRLALAEWPLQGFADHEVSEAVYLADPDGNGIEIYRDYPRSEWPYHNGGLRMVTDPLDIEGVMAELKREPESDVKGVHPDTVLGHVHLRVSSIMEAESFYCGLLGFDLVQRFGPAAGFVSAGGYHHHIGFNTWSSAGASPPAPGALGMRHYTVLSPNTDELEKVVARLRKAQAPWEETSAGYLTQDPSGNGVLLAI